MFREYFIWKETTTNLFVFFLDFFLDEIDSLVHFVVDHFVDVSFIFFKTILSNFPFHIKFR